MKKLFAISVILSGAILLYLTFPFSAVAEPERYDFPQLNPVSTTAKSGASTEKRALHKADEAKSSAIAALLRRHNKKLNNSQAREYTNFILQACEKFDQDPFVIAALIVNESSARPDAISRGGDYGLMQVRWKVHQKNIRAKYPHIDNAKDMLNPQNNLLVGTEIFSDCHERANEDVNGAIMYYSAGNRRLAAKVFADISRLERSYQGYLKNS